MFFRKILGMLLVLMTIGLASSFAAPEHHAADVDRDWDISLSELLRIVQLFFMEEYHCDATSEDGYAGGPGDTSCPPHDSDFAPQNWSIRILEVLRVVQFYNRDGYHVACDTEDGFAPGPGEHETCEGEPLSLSGALIYGQASGDQLGGEKGSVAHGDVNGDGFDDLVLGATYANPHDRMDAGAVYILYGSSERLPETYDVGEDVGNSATIIAGSDVGGRLGHGIACGDVDEDGFDDVMVGAPFASAPGRQQSGLVYIIYGSESLPGASMDLGSDSGGLQVTKIRGAQPGDGLGITMDSGDINGDGFDDIITGAPTSAPNGENSGTAYVLFGGLDLRGDVVDLADSPDAFWGIQLFGKAAGDHAGRDVASGDFNGDGIDDLAVGARRADPGGRSGAGEAYVVYGALGMACGSYDFSLPSGTYGETRILGDDPKDYLGQSVDYGDIDGDGYDDLLVGAYHGASSLPGEAYVIYGSQGLSGAQIDLSGGLLANGETRILGINPGDWTGNRVCAGDVDGDGYDDVLIGSNAADPNGLNRAGSIYLFSGANLARNTVYSLASGDDDLRLHGVAAYDRLGVGIASAADTDRDGFSEFAVTARNGDSPYLHADSDSGYVLLAYGAGISHSATSTEAFPAGATPYRGFGGRLSPVLRAHLAFDGGTRNMVRATLTRSSESIKGLVNGSTMDVANVLWRFTTARTGWSSASMMLQYLDSEVAGINEEDLLLVRADSPTGPWEAVSAQSLDVLANVLIATTSDLGYFALVAQSSGEGEGEEPGGETWTLATDAAPWARFDHASVAAGGYIWLLGGRRPGYEHTSEVWRSPDGVRWDLVQPDAPWVARSGHPVVVFDGLLWLMGSGIGNGRGNDVWSSADGVQWTEVVREAAWAPRFGHTVVAWNGAMWLAGGCDGSGAWYNDVWYSTNGADWTPATESASWQRRYAHASVAYDGKLWVMGGKTDVAYRTNDVWSSSDGITWDEVTTSADWAPRRDHTSVVHNGRMWVLGGRDEASSRNDVWWSDNGAQWTAATFEAEWSARYHHSSVVFDQRMWVIGGDGYRNDTWYCGSP